MWPSVSRMMPEPRPCGWPCSGLFPESQVGMRTIDGRTASSSDVKSACAVSGFELSLVDDALLLFDTAVVVDFEPPSSRAHVMPPTTAAPSAMLSKTMTNVLLNLFMSVPPHPASRGPPLRGPSASFSMGRCSAPCYFEHVTASG